MQLPFATYHSLGTPGPVIALVGCWLSLVMSATVAPPPATIVQPANQTVQIEGIGTVFIEDGKYINTSTDAQLKNFGGHMDIPIHGSGAAMTRVAGDTRFHLRFSPTVQPPFSQNSRSGFLIGSQLLSSSQPWTASNIGPGRHPYVI